MNIPVEVVCVFLAGVMGMQGWTLIEIVNLKTKVAILTQRVFHGRKSEDEEE